MSPRSPKPSHPRHKPPPAAPDIPADHTAPAERPPHATREEQLAALVDHMRRRDRRVARAIVTVLSDASPTVLASFGEVLGYVANQARHALNQARLDADRTIDAFRRAARGAL